MTKWIVRMLGCVAVVLALGLGLNAFANSWLGSEKGAFQLGRWLLFEVRRADALEQRAELVNQSWEAKHEIIGELVSGRMHLREAIVQFRQANQSVENADPDMVASYHTPTNPRLLARQVIAWARNEVSSWPDHKAERVRTTLEYQFEELFNHKFSDVPFEAWLEQEESSDYSAGITE